MQRIDVVTKQMWNALTATLSAWQAARKGELDASRNLTLSLAQSAQATAQQGVNAAQSLYGQAAAALGIPAARTSYTTALPALGAENDLGAWRDAYGNTVIGQVIGGKWVTLANQGSASTKAVQQAAASALAAPLLQRLRAGEGLRLGVLCSSTFSGFITADSTDPAVYQNSERGAGMRFWRTLANRYGNNNVTLINRGIGGARSRDLLVGNQPGVGAEGTSGVGLMSVEAMVRTFDLDAILVQMNHNDGGAISAEQYYQNLYWAYMGARRCGAMVFMVPPLAYGNYWTGGGLAREYVKAALRAAADAGVVILPAHEALANATRTGEDFTKGWYAYDNLHIYDAGAARYVDEMLSYLVDDVTAQEPNSGDGSWFHPRIQRGFNRTDPGVLKTVFRDDMLARSTVNEMGITAGHANLGQWSAEKQPFYLPLNYLPRRAVWAVGLGQVEAQGYGNNPLNPPVANALPDLTRFAAAPILYGNAPGAAAGQTLTAPVLDGVAYKFAGSHGQRVGISSASLRNLLFGRNHINVTVAVRVPPAASGINDPGGVFICRSMSTGTGWTIYTTGGGTLWLVIGGSVYDTGIKIDDDTLRVITLTAQAGAGKAWLYVDGTKHGEYTIGSDRTEFDLLLGARWADAGQTTTARLLTGKLYYAALGAAFIHPEEAAKFHGDLTTYLKSRGA